MRPLVVTELVTLDGVLEAPGGEPGHPHTGWAGDFMGADEQEVKFREVLDADVHLLGRRTYESFADAWPTYEGPFADRMNAMPKAVVSGTLREAAWHRSEVLPGSGLDAVRGLLARPGGQVLVAGSISLVHALLDAGMVDELRLMVMPVSVGGGRRLFPDSRVRLAWRPASSRTFDSGVRYDVYHRT